MPEPYSVESTIHSEYSNKSLEFDQANNSVPSISKSIQELHIKTPSSLQSYEDDSSIQLPLAHPDSDPDQKQHVTDWRSLWIANFLSFLTAVQYSVFLTSVWPYLLQISNQDVSQVYFGFVIAVFAFFQGSSAPLYGRWSNSIRAARPPILVGSVILIIGNFLYCYAEQLPDSMLPWRKWLVMLSRIVMGCGSGLQVIFSPLGYPGISVLGVINLNMYTAPALASLCGVVVIMVTMLTLFKEHYAGVHTLEEKSERFFVLPKFDNVAVFVVLYIWLAVAILQTNVEAILTPYAMIMYDWDDETAVANIGWLILIAGMVTAACYFIDERKMTIFGLTLFLIYHVITFPWPFYPGTIDYQITELVQAGHANINQSVPMTLTNTTKPVMAVGCQIGFDWCRYTHRVPKWVLFAAYDTFVAVGWVPIVVPQMVLYSKILGPRMQGTMQGLMTQTGCMGRTFAPILVTWLFSAYGPAYAWGMEIVILIVSIAVILAFYQRLVPLRTVQEMHYGEKAVYKNGVLYKL